MGTLTEWGSSAEERGQTYACDSLCPDASFVAFRAIDVDAPPALLFRWLCQLRVAPYSHDWLDNFGRTSPRTRDPANEQLAVGQPVMGMFRVAAFEPGGHLTLRIPSGPFRGGAVTYRVAPRPGGARLVVKLAMRVWAPLRPLLALGDLIMMRKQLRTLKQLAEHEHRAGS